jgi:hypothetical protein
LLFIRLDILFHELKACLHPGRTTVSFQKQGANPDWGESGLGAQKARTICPDVFGLIYLIGMY